MQNIAGSSSVPQVSFYNAITHMKFVHVIQVRPCSCRNNDLDHVRIVIGNVANFNARVMAKTLLRSAHPTAVDLHHVDDGISVLTQQHANKWLSSR